MVNTSPESMVKLEATGMTTGSDSYPEVTAVGNKGAYVVTFYGNGSDYNTSIYVQKFNADGSLAGGMVELDSQPDRVSFNSSPEVASIGTNGDYVVTFQGRDPEGDNSIFVQKFNADGTVSGGLVKLEATGVENKSEFDPQIVGIGTNGEFAVTYRGQSLNVGGAIFVQKFDANGAPTGEQVTLVPPGLTTGSQFKPQIAAVGATGEYAVTFYGSDIDRDQSVYVQMFKPDGTVSGDMIKLEPPGVTNGLDATPQIGAVGNSGEFVVTFAGSLGSVAASIFVQKFNADGSLAGDMAKLGAPSTGESYNYTPQVAALGTDGRYVVTFQGSGLSRNDQIFVQTFTADGKPSGDLVQLDVPNASKGGYDAPEVTAVGANGEFVVTFWGTDYDGDDSIFIQKFDADGNKSGDLIILEAIGVTNQIDSVPEIAPLGTDGSFVVTFQGKDQNGDFSVFVQQFDADGQPIGANKNPVAVADELETNRDKPFTIAANDLLANDTDPNGDVLSIVAVTNGRGGKVVLNADGTITFTPEGGYVGQADFTYTVSDGNGGTSVGTVNVNVVVPVSDAIYQGTEADDVVGIGSIDGDGTVISATAPNTVELYGGNDYVTTGAGNDLITTGAGVDTVAAGDGADTIYGGLDGDRLYGQDGDDLIYGEDGDDAMAGGNGNDILYGGLGNDGMHGELGDDYLYGDDGNDAIHGQAGIDTIYGGEGSDRIYGEEDNDILLGDGGADQIFGGSGNDIMLGGLGNDSMEGGDGDDRLYGDDGGDAMRAGLGNDLLYGGTGADRLYGDAGGDRLFGGADNDLMYGGLDGDGMEGGDGADRLFGDDGNDAVRGNFGNDQVYGGSGDDRVYGEGDDDFVFGDDGNDAVYGGAGADRLYGGTGNDYLFGGTEQDIFVFRAGDGQDRIPDFVDMEDKIQIDGGLNFSSLKIWQSGSSVVVEYGNADHITINYINVNLITQDDFIFT